MEEELKLSRWNDFCGHREGVSSSFVTGNSKFQ